MVSPVTCGISASYVGVFFLFDSLFLFILLLLWSILTTILVNGYELAKHCQATQHFKTVWPKKIKA